MYKMHKSQGNALTFFLNEDSALEQTELFIFSEKDASVQVLSGFSVFIWLGLEQGFSSSEILGLFEGESTYSSAHRYDFELELGRLNKLYKEGSLEARQIPDFDQSIQDITAYSVLDKMEGNCHNFSILCLGTSISLVFDEALSKRYRYLEGLLSNLKSDLGLTADLCLHIRNLNPGQLCIYLNGKELQGKFPENELVPRLLGVIRQLFKQRSSYQFATHAAALMVDDCMMVFPAVSGSGKSTLSATLLKRCRTRFFTDELALFDQDFNVLPMPVGIGVKEGAYEVLTSIWPELANQPDLFRPNGIKLKYLSAPYQKDIVAKKPNVFIFPCFDGQVLSVQCQKLSLGQSLMLLFEAGAHMKGEMDEHALQYLLEHMGKLPHYQLKYSSSEQLLDGVKAIIAECGLKKLL